MEEVLHQLGSPVDYSNPYGFWGVGGTRLPASTIRLALKPQAEGPQQIPGPSSIYPHKPQNRRTPVFPFSLFPYPYITLIPIIARSISYVRNPSRTPSLPAPTERQTSGWALAYEGHANKANGRKQTIYNSTTSRLAVIIAVTTAIIKYDAIRRISNQPVLLLHQHIQKQREAQESLNSPAKCLASSQ